MFNSLSSFSFKMFETILIHGGSSRYFFENNVNIGCIHIFISFFLTKMYIYI